MNFSEEREVIETYFQSNWDSITPVRYENDHRPPGTEPFARLLIDNLSAEQQCIGSQVHTRYESVVYISILVPTEITGSRRILELTDIVIEMFTQVEIEGLIFRNPQSVNIGEFESWFQRDIICPFHRDNVINR